MRNLTTSTAGEHGDAQQHACRAVLGAMEAEPEMAWATLHVGYTLEPGASPSRLVHWEHPLFTHDAVKQFVRSIDAPPDPFTPILDAAACTLAQKLQGTLQANMYDEGAVLVDAEAQVDLRGCMDLDADRNTLIRQVQLGAWSESAPPTELRGFLQQVQAEPLEFIPLGIPTGVSVLID